MENDREFYERDGKKYERVTRIIDYFAPPELVQWKMETGRKDTNRVSKIATKLGSRVHTLIETHWSTKDWNIKKDKDPEIWSCLQAWTSWTKDYNINNIKLGYPIYDDIHLIAGTFDFLLPEGNILVDIKTSREIRPQYFMQLGAYASMIDLPDKIAILRLDKMTAQYEYLTNENLNLTVKDCITGWTNLLDTYQFYQNLKQIINPIRAWPQKEIV